MKQNILYVVSLFCVMNVFAHEHLDKNDISTCTLIDSLEVDAAKVEQKISDKLTGGHFVYAYESDSIYQDQRVADWMKDSKVHIIRWPGGTAAQHYHWDDLSGIIPIKTDTWNPLVQDSLRRSPLCFMDLDEYIAYCRKVGAEPMVGVNYQSGRQFNKALGGKGLELSLDEAVRLIKYCKEKNYNVKYWYIGNEGFVDGLGPDKLIYYVDMYAAKLKEVDPNIKIITDWKLGIDKRYNQVIDIAKRSQHLDVIEIHEKWGNGNGLSYGKGGTFEVWRKQCPIFNGQMGQQIDGFYKEMAAAGKKVSIGFNEWGLNANGYKDADEFKCGLIAADFLLEMFRHKVSMACYWNLNIGNDSTRILKVDNYCEENAQLREVSVVGNPFVMISSAMGKYLINFTTSMKEVYGFAALSEDQSEMDIYLLNKALNDVEVPLNLKNFKIGMDIVQDCYEEPGNINHKIYNGGDRMLRLPKLSFSHFVLKSNESTGVTHPYMDANKSNDCFDLQGRRLQETKKGVNIIHGKKVLLK